MFSQLNGPKLTYLSSHLWRQAAREAYDKWERVLAGKFSDGQNAMMRVEKNDFLILSCFDWHDSLAFQSMQSIYSMFIICAVNIVGYYLLAWSDLLTSASFPAKNSIRFSDFQRMGPLLGAYRCAANTFDEDTMMSHMLESDMITGGAALLQWWRRASLIFSHSHAHK